MKLKVLGVDEASAAPWIVIMCDKSISKKVKRYFEQPLVKEAYQPCRTDSELPCFDIFILDRAPKPIAATSYVDVCGRGLFGSADITSWYGKVIRLSFDGKTRFATIGGLVQAFDQAGNSTLYGLTAGHVLFDGQTNDFGTYSTSLEHDFEEVMEADSWLQQHEDFELDLHLDEDYSQLNGGLENSATSAEEASQEEQETWSKLGHVFASSQDYEPLKADLDWALIKIDLPADDQPKLLEGSASRTQDDATPQDDATSRVKLRRSHIVHDSLTDPQEVHLLGGVSGLKDGMLSTTSSFLMMAPGKTFVETYTLSLSDQSGMCLSQHGTSVETDMLSRATPGRLRLMGNRQGNKTCLRLCGRV
jgi:hypothetical protein